MSPPHPLPPPRGGREAPLVGPGIRGPKGDVPVARHPVRLALTRGRAKGLSAHAGRLGHGRRLPWRVRMRPPPGGRALAVLQEHGRECGGRWRRAGRWPRALEVWGGCRVDFQVTMGLRAGLPIGGVKPHTNFAIQSLSPKLWLDRCTQ